MHKPEDLFDYTPGGFQIVMVPDEVELKPTGNRNRSDPPLPACAGMKGPDHGANEDD